MTQVVVQRGGKQQIGHSSRTPWRRGALLLAGVLGAGALWLGGCSSPPPKPRTIAPIVTRDVPAALRGTVGTETTLRNNEAVLVSGYGLVVGLNGTGGGTLPDRIASTMERELGLKGISKGSEALRGSSLEGMSPRELLRSRDVAVVIVYGAVVPGAPEGATFDVYVSPVSQAPDVSLEGGTLWTTELRLGPPTPTQGVKTTELARARGPVFINPFGSPGSSPGRQQGRVLGGGKVTKSLELQLVLDNESHSRSRAITDAVNNRFGFQVGGKDDLVARGRTARTIQVSVPAEYRDRADEFLNLLTHIQIQQDFPQEFAKRYTDSLRSEPYLADELSWALQALPQRAAVPFLRDLYDFPEVAPKMAALRAGAGLNDPTTVPHLERLAESGDSAAIRAEAVRLLGKITAGPAVDLALRRQLGARELTIRVAAYEALAQRAETVHMRRIAMAAERAPAGAFVASGDELRMRDILAMPGDTIQGVRRDVYPRKFLLDQIPGGEPLVYVAQQGRPRVVLFGVGLGIVRPVVFSMWDERLLIVADSATSDLRVMYRKPDRKLETGDVEMGDVTTAKAPADLPSFIDFLARQPGPEDPRPALGLTYSEVVGVLYALQRAGAINAAFAVEEDLLQARLLQATQQTTTPDRPETTKDAERQLRVLEPVTQLVKPEPKPVEKQPLVVPLPPPDPKK